VLCVCLICGVWLISRSVAFFSGPGDVPRTLSVIVDGAAISGLAGDYGAGAEFLSGEIL
jgi:hypothetical protein